MFFSTSFALKAPPFIHIYTPGWIELKEAKLYPKLNAASDTENPTIGIILCSEKNEAVVKYSVLNDSQQLFASKYLPSESELKAELERERLLAEFRLKSISPDKKND